MFWVVGGVTPNPMMSSFNRQCRLLDSKVIRLALCSLPLNGDGKRLWLTNSLLPLHSAVFSCLWYFHSVQGDFWLTYRKQPPLPIILGTKTQSARLEEDHRPVSHLLLCCTTEGWSMKSWFTMRFHQIDSQRSQIFKNNQCRCKHDPCMDCESYFSDYTVITWRAKCSLFVSVYH